MKEEMKMYSIKDIEKRFIDDYAKNQFEMYGIKRSIARASLLTLKKFDPKEYQRRLDDYFDTIHPY